MDSIGKLGDDNRYFANISILGNKVTGLFDVGAQITVIGAKFISLMNQLNLNSSPGTSSIRTADHTGHNIKSVRELPIHFRESTHIIKAAFVPTINEFLILGMDFWDAFQIKPAVCTISEEPKKPSVTRSHDLSIDQAEQLQNALKRSLLLQMENSAKPI